MSVESRRAHADSLASLLLRAHTVLNQTTELRVSVPMDLQLPGVEPLVYILCVRHLHVVSDLATQWEDGKGIGILTMDLATWEC